MNAHPTGGGVFNNRLLLPSAPLMVRNECAPYGWLSDRVIEWGVGCAYFCDQRQSHVRCGCVALIRRVPVRNECAPYGVGLIAAQKVRNECAPYGAPYGAPFGRGYGVGFPSGLSR